MIRRETRTDDQFCRCGALLGSVRYVVDNQWHCSTCYSEYLAKLQRFNLRTPESPQWPV